MSGKEPVCRLFLAGDVMTGRGIDQILQHPVDPQLWEPWVTSALDYVALAERRSGPIPRGVDGTYVWGDALELLDAIGPDVRIVNLETSVTGGGEPWPAKGIHYRMHPDNIDCLTSARIDCCVLANNHVLDFSYEGLADTLHSLDRAGLVHAGAGPDLAGAWAPAIVAAPSGPRAVVVAVATPSSGVPTTWAAGPTRPGVALVADLSRRAIDRIRRVVDATTRPGDLVVLSIHWGPNWGYEIPVAHRRFAHAVIDEAGVDVVHGHSSHHPMGIEVYRERPIIYGAGDLINDYEGISGHEEYRSELRLLYVPEFEAETLARFVLLPVRSRRFRLEHASEEEVRWLATTLTREGGRLGTRVARTDDGSLELKW